MAAPSGRGKAGRQPRGRSNRLLQELSSDWGPDIARDGRPSQLATSASSSPRATRSKAVNYTSGPEIVTSGDSDPEPLSSPGVSLGSPVVVSDEVAGDIRPEETVGSAGGCEADDVANDKANEIWTNLHAKAWLADVLAVDGNHLSLPHFRRLILGIRRPSRIRSWSALPSLRSCASQREVCRSRHVVLYTDKTKNHADKNEVPEKEEVEMETLIRKNIKIIEEITSLTESDSGGANGTTILDDLGILQALRTVSEQDHTSSRTSSMSKGQRNPKRKHDATITADTDSVAADSPAAVPSPKVAVPGRLSKGAAPSRSGSVGAGREASVKPEEAEGAEYGKGNFFTLHMRSVFPRYFRQ